MTKFLLLILIAAWPVQSDDESDFDDQNVPGLSSAEISEGWISLFDGQSLFGWRRESSTNWEVEDGTIVVSNGDVGLLRTSVQFDDFEMRLDFLADATTNSGVFIRSSPDPKNPKDDCLEINIAPDSNPFPTGSIVAHRQSKGVSLNDDWNRMSIRANGDRIVVAINDRIATEHILGESAVLKGFVGLQHNSGQVRFRNIAIRPLNVAPIFNGKDLTGWKDNQKLESSFLIDETKSLKMTGGRGQLESEKRYGDFVFFAHIRTNAIGLNSGVFFRCIPGELMNGYESQIQNQFENGDRRKPVDFGSGGIFRRQPARIINSTDKKWFAKMIVADGATICVWVNGYQVVDWTDKRKPHVNPRKGRRLESGTIILQGHDPTTDLNFKDLRARELRKRRK